MSTLKKYIPNALSLSRSIVFPPILFYICYFLPQEHISFLYAGLLAGYTDWADGHYARKWKVISEFGKLADPIGDKICTALIVIPLLLRDVLPLWLGIPILFRDAVIIIGSMLVMEKQKELKAIPSKWSGKIAFTVISVTTLVYYYNYVEWFPLFAVLTAVVFVWSLTDYSRVFFLKLNNFQI
jgi:CDP-diacylglycerol--glycerol-3-phosphate 3-phosphatidyltransferase